MGRFAYENAECASVFFSHAADGKQDKSRLHVAATQSPPLFAVAAVKMSSGLWCEE